MKTLDDDDDTMITDIGVGDMSDLKRVERWRYSTSTSTKDQDVVESV